MQYTVGMQYTVDVSAKRLIHTVDLANMGGGDHYLQCKKVKPHAVRTQYAVGVDAKRSTHTVYFLHQHLLRTASPTVWGLTFLH